MKAQRIDVHINRIRIHGSSTVNPGALREAVCKELSRLLASPGTQAPSIGASSTELGRRIARAVYKEIKP